MKLETLALHHGYTAEPTTKAAAVPIYQTTSYTFDNTQHGADLFDLKVPGNIYSRIMNPTNAVLEQRVAEMEGGIAGLVVASGMSAITYAIQAIAGVGDNIVSISQLYGGTYNLFMHSFPRQGIEVRMADQGDFEGLEKLIDKNTKAVFCESIGNPAGNVVDIQRLAEIAHRHGVPVIVDNTVATPYLCKPFEHGADIVVHSLTKFLGGHGNSLGGIIVDAGTFDWSKDNKYPMLNEPRPEYHGIRIQETFGNFAFAIACRVLGLRDLGPAISPFNAFMILTGIETLPLRMQKHCENAKAIAEFLAGHSAVASVNYAGLASDKYNKLARKYASKGAGAVFTFSLRGGYDAGVNLVSNLKLFSHLANVGDTRSLVIHPASTTHSQLDDAAKVKSGAAPDVVRLSIGIEDKEDLIADLEQALSA